MTYLTTIEEQRDPEANRFYVKKRSKRRERIVRMYWAFRKADEYPNDTGGGYTGRH